MLKREFLVYYIFAAITNLRMKKLLMVSVDARDWESTTKAKWLKRSFNFDLMASIIAVEADNGTSSTGTGNRERKKKEAAANRVYYAEDGMIAVESAY